MIISAGFLYVGILDNLGPSAIYMGLLLLGGVYYLLRREYLQRRNISLEELLRQETEQHA